MSLVAEQFTTNSVLLNSKKIKKVKKPLQSPESLTKADPSEDGNSNFKKYKTFQTTTKKAILFDIKRGIMQLYNMPYNDKELDSEELLKLVSKADLSAYNKLLKEVLAKHISTFTSSQKSLTQWRKKIKGWLYTSEKPEYRGSPVVTSEKLPVFREEVIKILKELPFRCFSSLRQNILGVLLKFHKANPATQETAFNPNVCSKHWWFNFMQKNTDIKEMWEKIPLKRETSKHNIDLQGSQHSTENTSQEIEEEKTPNLLMADPIFSSRFMPQGHEHTGDATSKHNIMGVENFSHIVAAARNAAFERLCREAFLMKIMTSLQIPPFQGQPYTESTAVKIEAKPELKVEAKVEVQNAKKEEPETIVKMEEEMIKLAKSVNDS